jgi:hypothetical protein
MKLIVCLLVLLVCAPLVSAQQPWLTDAERAHFEELRRSGLDALYNIDYDKAQRDFKEIVQLYPNHPGGYQLLAARLWIKTLYESRRLQASRLIKRLDPDARCQQLITSGMIWKELNDLFEVALCFVVVDVVKSIESAAPQLFESGAFCIR